MKKNVGILLISLLIICTSILDAQAFKQINLGIAGGYTAIHNESKSSSHGRIFTEAKPTFSFKFHADTHLSENIALIFNAEVIAFTMTERVTRSISIQEVVEVSHSMANLSLGMRLYQSKFGNLSRLFFQLNLGGSFGELGYFFEDDLKVFFGGGIGTKIFAKNKVSLVPMVTYNYIASEGMDMVYFAFYVGVEIKSKGY